MLHIFAEPARMREEFLTIEGGQYNHIRNVLRMKKGEEISVSDGTDRARYLYEVWDYGQDRVILKKKGLISTEAELPVRVILFQGLPKSDKMEWIIQKAVELGVTDIVPVSMKRCVMRLDPKKADKKIQRWQTIAESAAMQSKRALVPRVHGQRRRQSSGSCPMSCRRTKGRQRPFSKAWGKALPFPSSSAPKEALKNRRWRRPERQGSCRSPLEGGSCGPKQRPWWSFPG